MLGEILFGIAVILLVVAWAFIAMGNNSAAAPFAIVAIVLEVVAVVLIFGGGRKNKH